MPFLVPQVGKVPRTKVCNPPSHPKSPHQALYAAA